MRKLPRNFFVSPFYVLKPFNYVAGKIYNFQDILYYIN